MTAVVVGLVIAYVVLVVLWGSGIVYEFIYYRRAKRIAALEDELYWWRSEFGTRVIDSQMPRVGSSLAGKAFVLYEQHDNGYRKPYRRD